MTSKGVSMRRTETSDPSAKRIPGLAENLWEIINHHKSTTERSEVRKVTRKVIGHLFSEFTAKHGVEISIRGFRKVLQRHAYSERQTFIQIFSLKNIKTDRRFRRVENIK